MIASRVVLSIAVASALAGCAIPNSRTNAVVVTDNKAVVEGCRKIGDIDGDGPIGQTVLMDRARDSAVARLKARGAEINGTHVLSEVANINWKRGSTAGMVFVCTS